MPSHMAPPGAAMEHPQRHMFHPQQVNIHFCSICGASFTWSSDPDSVSVKLPHHLPFEYTGYNLFSPVLSDCVHEFRFWNRYCYSKPADKNPNAKTSSLTVFVVGNIYPNGYLLALLY